MKKNGGVMVAASVIAACICMGIVDAVIQPGYVVKSIIKGILFICIPVLYAFLKRDRGICQVIIPNKIKPESFKIEQMWDIETGEEISHVNPGKEGQKVILKIPFEVQNGWILRRKK